jgi:hypothetical protein
VFGNIFPVRDGGWRIGETTHPLALVLGPLKSVSSPRLSGRMRSISESVNSGPSALGHAFPTCSISPSLANAVGVERAVGSAAVAPTSRARAKVPSSTSPAPPECRSVRRQRRRCCSGRVATVRRPRRQTAPSVTEQPRRPPSPRCSLLTNPAARAVDAHDRPLAEQSVGEQLAAMALLSFDRRSSAAHNSIDPAGESPALGVFRLPR